MKIVDTNILYAYFMADDSCHEKVLELVKEAPDIKWFLIPEVWQELMSVLSVRHNASVAVQINQLLQQFSNIQWYEHNYKASEIWNEIFANKISHRLSYTDCVLLFLTQKKQTEIVTLDKEILKYV